MSQTDEMRKYIYLLESSAIAMDADQLDEGWIGDLWDHMTDKVGRQGRKDLKSYAKEEYLEWRKFIAQQGKKELQGTLEDLDFFLKAPPSSMPEAWRHSIIKQILGYDLADPQVANAAEHTVLVDRRKTYDFFLNMLKILAQRAPKRGTTPGSVRSAGLSTGTPPAGTPPTATPPAATPPASTAAGTPPASPAAPSLSQAQITQLLQILGGTP